MTPNPQDVFSTVVFSANNNQAAVSDVTGLIFGNSVWGFDVYLAARLQASTPAYTNFHIRGVNKGSSWELVKTYVGDDTGFSFPSPVLVRCSRQLRQFLRFY
jgi:hypothetical protein